MQQHSLRTDIATSSFTLPVTATLVAVLWLLPAPLSWQQLGGAGLTFALAYLLSEWNNRFALLRVRSRMVSTTFLALMAAIPAYHALSLEMVSVVCLALAYLCLSSSYQKPRPEVDIFNAFLLLSIGSAFCLPMLALAVTYYVSMIFQLRSFTVRSFFAALLGLAVPCVFAATLILWFHQSEEALSFITDYAFIAWPTYGHITLLQLVNLSFLLLAVLFATVHFFHTAYNDKIRTRMLFYVIFTQELVLVCLLLVFPNHFTTLVRLLVFNSAPLIAHHLATARGRFPNFWFHFLLWCLVALLVLNHLSQYDQLGVLTETFNTHPLAAINMKEWVETLMQ